MAAPTETDVVEQEVKIDASPETVFAYFIDPHKIVRWKGRSAELDPRPGGIYRVQINDEAVARGTYVEVVPHSKVVFTWGWEGDANPVVPGSSTVEVTLTPDGNGTIVRLVHRDLPVEERASHADGWKQYLGRLALVVEGKDPGPDPHAESS